MASVYSGTTVLNIGGTYRDSSRDLATPSTPIAIPVSHTWASGLAMPLYDEQIDLAAAAVNRDLYGSLVDMHGNTLSYATIRGVLIQNLSETTAEPLLVSGNFITGSILSGWVDDAVKLIIHPEGEMWFAAQGTVATDAYDVDNTTKERITLDPGAKSFSVNFVVFGTI